MHITLKREHTGKNNYTSNDECPIAMALKDAGFTNINVGASDIKAIDPDGNVYTCGVYSRHDRPQFFDDAHDWDTEVQEKDHVFELPPNGESWRNL